MRRRAWRIETLLVPLVLGLAVSFCSCGKQPEATTVVEEAPLVLAEVGDRQITEEDLRQEMARLRQAGRPVPDAETVLRDLVTYEAARQRVRETGLEQDPGIRREIDNLLIAKLKEREWLPRLNALEISEEELEAAYTARIETFTSPEKIRLAILFRETSRHMSEEKRLNIHRSLREARQRLAVSPAPSGRGSAGRGFGALAIEYSGDQSSRYRGGDIGWMEARAEGSRWPAKMLEAGFALSVGEVSDLIETAQGCFVVMKTDARHASVRTLDQVRSSLRQQLLAEKREVLRETFQAEIWTLAGASVDERAMAKLDPALRENESLLAARQDAEPPRLPLMDSPSGGQ